MNKRQRKKEQQKIKNYLMYCACSYTEVRRIKQSYKMYLAEIRRLKKHGKLKRYDGIDWGEQIELCIECRELLEHQPTAYDVDKVLEQLEYKVKEYDERIEKRKGPTFFDETERIKQFDERAWGIEIAIEIVKGGGIDGNTNT